ncbi:hypothetical protein PVK06_003612 [Gossypium arboreum]|uniref:Uncharacterized protein n=1 Tax=Gossypium arboreum TaxID=29729 RepID=A0ABR0R7V7_GOSAR|nr:hypothetical protein PVK06_003612 [Gossypium arboreum]
MTGVKVSQHTREYMTLFMLMVFLACTKTSAVIFRDDVDVINKVSSIAKGMRWDIKMVDDADEGGPLVTEKILVAVKQYWVGSNGGNSTVNDE